MRDRQLEEHFYLCENCQCEIFSGEPVYEMSPVYGPGLYLIHEHCLAQSLEKHPKQTFAFLQDDMHKLAQAVAEELVLRHMRRRLFE